MGLFNLFSGKKNNQEEPGNQLFEKVPFAPGITASRIFTLYKEQIETTKRTYISIKATPARPESFRQSSFGYCPCLPSGFDYPKDLQGEYMYPLAQINFSELPPLPGYPVSGYLQFYISISDDVYGLDFDNQQIQEGFRVLYFEEEEVKDCITDFSFLQPTLDSDASPIYEPHSLEFTIKEEYMGPDDVAYDNNGGKILAAIVNDYPELEDEIDDAVYEDFNSTGHKIGGYAYFTQTDPRSYSNDNKDTLLLLQIDSDDKIMWGDMGVSNFFIHREDLARKDFSTILYNWDCG